jgi:hypothetical protein
MTPPAAAAATRTRTNRTAAAPRRVSGPARGRTRAAAVAAPPPLALRLGGAVHNLAEHHFLDRLIRGRAWIGILAVGLMGIVFMQVSMLRMNAGIGEAVEKTSTLERENSAMRAAISELSSGDRIAAEAAKLGLILPAGTARFLDARGTDARKAASMIGVPGENIVPSMTPAETEQPVDPASTTPVLSQSSIAPTSDSSPTTESGAPVTTESTTATTTTDPAATTTSTPPTTQTTDPAATQTTAPPPTTASTGGMDASGQVG